ncbi:hypothetical protein BU14_0580s0008 [Porphyra umbilicalis]|uniref:Uncharacterized protein n=1 Tax=Porphyra umbilicalis TaxID=2786 RepID=A0A1X6NRF3_PORUM|nr:hypothetical protein BU14_0580s0008 [Porphyra umbilicalis]|eukprot:OSX71184.1 hypothetical protein BU14_0580s0008 [Porphyra umbilicalis]
MLACPAVAAAVVDAAAAADAAAGGGAAAALRPSTRVRDVAPAQWAALDGALGRWAAVVVGTGPFCPTISLPPSVLGYALLPNGVDAPPAAGAATTASEVVEGTFAAAERAAAHTAAARGVVRSLAAAGAKSAARLADATANASEARDAPTARRSAERLVFYAITWSPGDAAVIASADSAFATADGDGRASEAPSTADERIPVPADTPVPAAGALYALAVKPDRARRQRRRASPPPPPTLGRWPRWRRRRGMCRRATGRRWWGWQRSSPTLPLRLRRRWGGGGATGRRRPRGGQGRRRRCRRRQKAQAQSHRQGRRNPRQELAQIGTPPRHIQTQVPHAEVVAACGRGACTCRGAGRRRKGGEVGTGGQLSPR